MPTVSTTVLKEITQKVKPPRALFLDRPLGYPLGAPGDTEFQERVIRQALAMLSRRVSEPLIENFRE